jgi:hypothetical protein
VNSAAHSTQAFFKLSEQIAFDVIVLPDRASFNSVLHNAWGMQESACWMVGSAFPNELVLLTPRVWKTEACEHDPADWQHINDLITHELVHLVHMRANPSKEFEGVAGLDWFIEGLATYAAGQLDRNHLNRAEEAVKKGATPSVLAEAWTGDYRYGVSGSLVRYIDHHYGRPVVLGLMKVESLDEALRELGISERELLQRWEYWVENGE